MSNDSYPPSGSHTKKRHKTFLNRLADMFDAEPETQEQLLEILHNAHERELFDDDALSIMEGALRVSTLKARDIMIPRAQMDGIDIEDAPSKFIPMIIETSHSRFPVFEGERDKVIGLLLAKDLLRYYNNEDAFNVRENLRPAMFVPESKPLNVLLREFRQNRNHMAMVVDEYGEVAGLVTIEDVLEEIVGDIEDEYDEDEAENFIRMDDGRLRLRALTEIDVFNEHFHAELSDEEFDTIGGLIISECARIPQVGERVLVMRFEFEVVEADERQVHQLLVREFSDEELLALNQREDDDA